MTTARRPPARHEREWRILDTARRLGRVTGQDALDRSKPRPLSHPPLFTLDDLMHADTAGHLRRVARGTYRLTPAGWGRLAVLDDDRAALAGGTSKCKHCARRRKAGLAGRCPACVTRDTDIYQRRPPEAVIECEITVEPHPMAGRSRGGPPAGYTQMIGFPELPPGRYRVTLRRIS